MRGGVARKRQVATNQTAVSHARSSELRSSPPPAAPPLLVRIPQASLKGVSTYALNRTKRGASSTPVYIHA